MKQTQKARSTGHGRSTGSKEAPLDTVQMKLSETEAQFGTKGQFLAETRPMHLGEGPTLLDARIGPRRWAPTRNPKPQAIFATQLQLV